MSLKFNFFTGNFDLVGDGASIGGSIPGGLDGSVLFVHPAGVIAQDNNNFFYNSGTLQLNAGSLMVTANRGPFVFGGNATFDFISNDTRIIAGSNIVGTRGSFDIILNDDLNNQLGAVSIDTNGRFGILGVPNYELDVYGNSFIHGNLGVSSTPSSNAIEIGAAGADYKISSGGQLWLVGNSSGSASFENLILQVDPPASGNGVISFQTGVNPNAGVITNGGQWGMGTSTPDSSALLDMTASGLGVLLPRMGTGSLPGSPATGLMLINSDFTDPQFYNGGSWDYLYHGPSFSTGIVLTSTGVGGYIQSSGVTIASGNYFGPLNLWNGTYNATFDNSALANNRQFNIPNTYATTTLPVVVGNATIKGQTAAATVISVSSVPTGEYIVGGGINISAVTLKTVKLQVQYNDQNNTLQTIDLFPQGLTNAVLSTTGTYLYGSVCISCSSGSNINVFVTQVIAGTSITYDAWATATQLHI